MFRQYFRGLKDIANVSAGRDGTFSLTKNVWQDPGIGYRNHLSTVRYGKGDRLALTTHQSAFNHQTAKAENLIRIWLISDHLGR